MLTNEGFVRKLKELFARYPQAGTREIELLKWGRHFRLPEGAIGVIGRQQGDNEKLRSLAGEGDVLLRVLDYPGPTGLVLGAPCAERDLRLAVGILIAYSDAPSGDSSQEFKVETLCHGTRDRVSEKNYGREYYKEYLI